MIMKLKFSLFFLFLSLGAFSQEPVSTEPLVQEEVLQIAEKMPSFPGGMEAMFAFIKENVKYPKEAKKKDIEGTCYIRFTVEKNGSLSDIHVIRGVPNGPMCDEEALRVVKMFPAWIPGEQNGEKKRVIYNIPIKFKLK